MTVRELIEELEKMPVNAVVRTEVCDCTGVVAGVELEEDGEVLITRP